jgi:DNA polymerase delta subunit 4
MWQIRISEKFNLTMTNFNLDHDNMAPQKSSPTKAHGSKSSGLRQGTLSFASAKRSGSTTAKDSLKGKAVVPPAEPAKITPIRISRKRKYEPDPEPEHEQAKDTIDAVERETLDTEDRRWNKVYGLAREKMGNIQPGSSLGRPSSMLSLADRVCVYCVVHAKDQSPVHHILRVFDLYVFFLRGL